MRHDEEREVAVVRDAFTLPLIFLTVALFGGFRSANAQGMWFLPPPLIALILAAMLIGLLIRTGTLAPDRLMRSDRSVLENLSGAIVLATLFAATAQVFNLVTPETGLLHFIFTSFFLLLLWNTLAAQPDRPRLLRSLAVLFGGAFILKYIVLASLYDARGGLAKRVLMTLLEGVTLGGLQYESPAALTGYIAFFTLALYLIGVMLLPYPMSRRGLLPQISRRHEDPQRSRREFCTKALRVLRDASCLGDNQRCLVSQGTNGATTAGENVSPARSTIASSVSNSFLCSFDGDAM